MRRFISFYNNLSLYKKISIMLVGGLLYSLFVLFFTLYSTNLIYDNFKKIKNSEINLMLISDDIKTSLFKLQNEFISQITLKSIGEGSEEYTPDTSIQTINNSLLELQKLAIAEENSDLIALSQNLNIRYKAFLSNGIDAVDAQMSGTPEDMEDAVFAINALGSIADKMNEELNHLVSYSRENLNKSTASFSDYISNIMITMITILGISITIFFAFGAFFTKNLVRRIGALTKGVRDFAGGCKDCKVSDPYNDEIGELSRSFNIMSDSIRELMEKQKEANKELDLKVKEKTKEISKSMEKLEKANTMIVESMNYAGRIQNSLLPDTEKLKSLMGEHFVVWNQRDIVGGDFYSVEEVKDGYVVALIDCTGHSVPGALMSMMAVSMFDRIVKDKHIIYPNEILQHLNIHLRDLLGRQDGFEEDGLEAGICYVDKKSNKLYFSGAGISLFYVDNKEVKEIKSQRVGIGYKKTALDFEFKLYEIENIDNMSFYMTTDGIIEQVGGEKRRMFGKKRFKALIENFAEMPKHEQRKALLQGFHEYKMDEPQRDDMSCIGFKPH
ncbi:MAG: SpoIIE family protein phosphatase [Campylobacterales bacterium]